MKTLLNPPAHFAAYLRMVAVTILFQAVTARGENQVTMHIPSCEQLSPPECPPANTPGHGKTSCEDRTCCIATSHDWGTTSPCFFDLGRSAGGGALRFVTLYMENGDECDVAWTEYQVLGRKRWNDIYRCTYADESDSRLCPDKSPSFYLGPNIDGLDLTPTGTSCYDPETLIVRCFQPITT